MHNYLRERREDNSQRSSRRSGSCLSWVCEEQRACPLPLAGLPEDSLPAERGEGTIETGAMVTPVSTAHLRLSPPHGVSVRGAYLNLEPPLIGRATPCALALSKCWGNRYCLPSVDTSWVHLPGVSITQRLSWESLLSCLEEMSG